MHWLQLGAALSRPLTRSFAELVSIPSTQFTSPPSAKASISGRKQRSNLPPQTPKGGRVPVRDDHGLYAFFRRKGGNNLTGEDRYEVVETPEDGRMISGICDCLFSTWILGLCLRFKEDLGKLMNFA